MRVANGVLTHDDNNKNEITHKELLTFSNLANLEWQFVNLSSKGDKDTGTVVSTKLKDVLSDPKSFVRKNAEGEIEKYEYMEGVKKEEDITPEHLEKGLFQMRQKAGIAMEYLEKSKECDEGKFIQDWEVIYGADNYKVVTEFLGFA
ncbi:hypothetical protein U472_13270 [Orenia metallireducens]|uniref:Uncharacterized protein n=1 Tax=Orenia metallireducens TaxID=1413210 RepID=A0A1C0A5A8_9FIRM|nr:hypothetical protein [Orenia metallireducens]OCL25322.1 hypothetical protein U472_13270 [Orenia metallireducens]